MTARRGKRCAACQKLTAPIALFGGPSTSGKRTLCGPCAVEDIAK